MAAPAPTPLPAPAAETPSPTVRDEAPAPVTEVVAETRAPAPTPSPAEAAATVVPAIDVRTPAETTATPTVPAAPATPPRLADLLVGFELPEAIAPVRTEVQPRDDYLALTAASVEPESVGGSVADELERLGYTLRLLGDTDALATRAGDAVSIRIHPSASIGLDGVARPGRGQRVLVELWSGGGPRPD